MKIRFISFLFLVWVTAQTGFAQSSLAPNAPGKDAYWTSAGKQAVGTSATLESKVWFTLAQGMMTEVYYPTVDKANVHLLQFIVVNTQTKKVETERDDANHQVKVLRNDSMSFMQINTAKSGEWKIIKTYTTDPKSDAVLIDVQFETTQKNLSLYVYYDPSLNNSGMYDTAWNIGDAMLAQDGNVVSALSFIKTKADVFSEMNLEEQTNGYYQTSDGLEQLKQHGKIVTPYTKAEKGNVVQLAKISQPKRFTAILSFGDSVDNALKNAAIFVYKPFERCQAEYDKGWSDYVKTIPKIEAKYQPQLNMAAMVLKAHEDKTFRGANVASLTVPWGNTSNEPGTSGYHLVWSRDLYQVATAYMALGDKAAAMRALDYLFKYQQKPDGSFPQISWLDGRTVGDSIQMDEVSYPLILAYQLGKWDAETYKKHIKITADYIVRNGPKTQQERWEEEAGFSPSTIAAEIAGLVCAAEIAKKNGDDESAKTYLETADNWTSNIEKWTVTTTGKYGDGNYYLRITRNGEPDSGAKIELNNGAGLFDEREIVDAGFLELVRLGIKPHDDKLIVKSLKIVDEKLKVNTPNGEAWYRYSHDGYGETYDGKRWNWDATWRGNGHLWILLTGERGEYEIERGEVVKAKTRLDMLLNFANDGLMLPEQIWDKPEIPNADPQFIPRLKFGEGTGSATPLAWSMAQFIRLALNLRAGKNLEKPDIVFNRYINTRTITFKMKEHLKCNRSCIYIGSKLFNCP